MLGARNPRAFASQLSNRTEMYLHAIVVDFEAMLDDSKRRQATKDLLFESEHVPVLVSLAETLDGEPEHISSEKSLRADPEILGSSGPRRSAKK